MKTKKFEAFVASNARQGIEDLTYSFMGLAGEAGECCEWYKKAVLRKDSSFVDQDLLEELGDVIHYVVRIGLNKGWSLKDIMQANVDKLEERHGA